uniref:Uncharacterized protein n=1 Tax=viral metagenome TaxID=1070528 RepID=A0A6C0C957_9ZZZZ
MQFTIQSIPMQFSLVPNSRNFPVIGTSMGNDLEQIVSSLNALKIKYAHHLTVVGHTLEFQVTNTFFHCLYLEDKQKFILTGENTFLGNIYEPKFLNSRQLRDFLFDFIFNLSMMTIGAAKNGLGTINSTKQVYDLAKTEFNQNVMVESAKQVLDLAMVKYLYKDKTFLISGKINFSIILVGEWFVFKNGCVTFKRTNQANNVHRLTVR